MFCHCLHKPQCVCVCVCDCVFSTFILAVGVPVSSRVSTKIQQLLNTLKRPKRPPLSDFFTDDSEEIVEGTLNKVIKEAPQQFYKSVHHIPYYKDAILNHCIIKLED